MGRHDRQREQHTEPQAPVRSSPVEARPLEESLAAEALRAPPPALEPSYWQLQEDFSQSVRGTYLTYRAGSVVSSKRLPSVVKLLKQFGAKILPVPEAAVPFIERLTCGNCGRSYCTGR